MDVECVESIPPSMRQAYLASLPEPQELFVEGLVRTSRKFLMVSKGTVVGYANVSGATLVELFMVDRAWTDALDALVAVAGVERILCKTFDRPLLDVATRRAKATRVDGHLFRRLDLSTSRAVPRLTGRLATAHDIDAVLSMHDGFFDDTSEVQDYIANNGLFLYSDDDGLLGCGVRRRIIEGHDAVDVGMVVAIGHRGRGLGARIIANLALHCLAVGDRPICGCAVDNVASRRSLESAGFRSEHELVEFSLLDGADHTSVA
jgi:RimJ/RimL family protein N-acetyltransferase